MKKITLLTLCAIAAMMFTSCAKLDDKSFIGTWGVEKIEYYNIDYAGNPISASMKTFEMVPGDEQSGIDLIFREMRCVTEAKTPSSKKSAMNLKFTILLSVPTPLW